MKFKIWLENEQDDLEHKIASFIFGKIKQASELALQSKQQIRVVLPQVWENNSRGIKFYLPKDHFPPEISQIEIRFPPSSESDTTRVNGQVATWNFSLEGLDAAKDSQEAQQALNRIGGTIQHEVTHLHHKGADLDSGDTSGGSEGQAERAIKYLIAPGELRAHAKDYAFTWSRLFPNQPFNPQQFIQQVIPQLGSKSKQTKATNYFVAFSDPIKQSKWKLKNLDLMGAYNNLIAVTTQYVAAFNQRLGSQHSQHSQHSQIAMPQPQPQPLQPSASDFNTRAAAQKF